MSDASATIGGDGGVASIRRVRSAALRARTVVTSAVRGGRRRIAARTSFVDPPEVDQDRRNERFGAARRIGVLHVPKSAGSSVSAALVGALADRSWAPFTFDPQLFGPLRSEPVPPDEAPRVLRDPTVLRRHDAASGHFALSTMLAGFDAADLVLLLREPRSRLLSHYEYWRGLPEAQRDPSRTWSVTATASELDFADWLVDPRVAYQTDNIVVRTLLAGHPAIPDDALIDSADLDRLVPLAIRRCRTIGWVDLVERGDAMWDGLEERIGRTLERPRVNTTERRGDLPTDVDAVVSDVAVLTLHHRTRGDRAVWDDVARRRDVDDAGLVAERAWFARLAVTIGVELDRT